jgi:hypothetical protein
MDMDFKNWKLSFYRPSTDSHLTVELPWPISAELDIVSFTPVSDAERDEAFRKVQVYAERYKGWAVQNLIPPTPEGPEVAP